MHNEAKRMPCRAVFMQDKRLREFPIDGATATVHLLFRTDDTSRIPEAYRDAWFDSIDQMLEKLDAQR
ncbi:hypothetical protein TJA_25150 [Thermus sp. LT1-2-5]